MGSLIYGCVIIQAGEYSHPSHPSPPPPPTIVSVRTSEGPLTQAALASDWVICTHHSPKARNFACVEASLGT